MRRRALIGALSATLLLLPLISAWCPWCLAGSCSTEMMAAGASPAAADGPCHPVDADPGLAIAAADTDCCATAVGSAPPALNAPIAVVHVGFHLEAPLGAAAPVAPQLSYERGEDHAPRPQELSTPLYTLHSSLLL